jgi:hypothetical protein
MPVPRTLCPGRESEGLVACNEQEQGKGRAKALVVVMASDGPLSCNCKSQQGR